MIPHRGKEPRKIDGMKCYYFFMGQIYLSNMQTRTFPFEIYIRFNAEPLGFCICIQRQ